MNARIDEMIIVKIIIIKCEVESFFRISFTATAEPVLVLFIENIVMKERAMTTVLIMPTRKRNERGLVSVNSDAKTAECPEPIPGRKEDNGAVKDAAKEVFTNSFFGIFIEDNFCRDCFGILFLFLRDIMIADEPNSPVRRGRSGSLTGRFRVRKPRKPASVKTVRDIRNSSSLKIR